MSMLGLEQAYPRRQGDPAGKNEPDAEAAGTAQRSPDQSTQPGKTPASAVMELPRIESLRQRVQVVLGSRFEVLQAVAIGGMATIFQLRHRLHQGLFVAKVLHPELSERPSVLRSFRSEAIHAARLGTHPNAVPIFDFGELDGLFFMLMQYVEGEDLDGLLHRSGPLPRAEVLQLAAQISSLLSHAESAGITHCDITPGNIRLDSFGRYRLLDFGISRSTLFEDRQEDALAGGTPLYASPEQLRGQPLSIRSDLYSLGTVLAEALTGTPLFHGTSLEDIKRRHLQGEWDMPASLAENDPLTRLLQYLLAVDPVQRIASAFELSGILDALGQTRPEFRTSLPPIPRRNAAEPARRRLSI